MAQEARRGDGRGAGGPGQTVGAVTVVSLLSWLSWLSWSSVVARRACRRSPSWGGGVSLSWRFSSRPQGLTPRFTCAGATDVVPSHRTPLPGVRCKRLLGPALARGPDPSPAHPMAQEARRGDGRGA